MTKTKQASCNLNHSIDTLVAMVMKKKSVRATKKLRTNDIAEMRVDTSIVDTHN